MSKTLILFTDRYPFGKAETFLENEIKYFASAFTRVVIFPLQRGDDDYVRNIPENALLEQPVFKRIKKSPELIFKGIFNTSCLKKFFIEGFKSGALHSPSRFRIWITHLLMIRAILSYIKKNNLIAFFNEADVLFFNWGLRWSQVIPFLPENLRTRIAVRFHGSDLYEHLNSDYVPWRREQIKRIDSVITVSEAGKNYLSTKYAIPKENIFISRIGTPDFGLNPYEKTETVRIVSCSNIVPVKRVELIALALKYLKLKVEWIHFGEGPLKQKVTELAMQLPGNISWQFPGEINHEKLMNFYKTVSVDLFLNVSSSEGVPISVMEALSFGIPVIATNAGGTSEIVTEPGGVIIPVEFEPSFLAEKIENIVNAENYLQMRQAARKTWEEKCREDKLYPLLIEFLLNNPAENKK